MSGTLVNMLRYASSRQDASRKSDHPPTVPAVGPVAGTVGGWSLFRDASWRELAYLNMFTNVPDIRAFAPYKRGFIAFSERHALEWGPGLDCGQVNLFPENTDERKI